MRFTKIPLIATLMAVALSLLIVLPTLAQVSGDRTDGRLSVGNWIDVRVADNVADVANDTADPPTTNAIGATFRASTFNAKDTFFNGDLYVSNSEDAYNTILISAAVADADLADNTETDDPCATGTSAAVAKIKNDRSGTTVTAYLVNTNTPGTGAAAGRNIYQAIVAVWDQEDSVEAHNALCQLDTNAPALPNGVTLPDHGDPEKYEGSTEQTNNEAATPDPYADPEDGWTRASAAVIPARDGDTLTVTVNGVSGSIKLIVDGDEPEIEDTVPANGRVTKDNTVNLGFTVTDDGAGIRYDGESGSSTDADLQPHNGDGDQSFDEPITHMGAGSDGVVGTADDAGNGDGSTMDIKVFYGTDKDALTDDVSELGSNDWTQRSRGVEYALDMRIVGQAFDTYYWQVTAKDRVGNEATTDGDEDEPSNQPFSFKVDDAKPQVTSARTGIRWEAGEGEKRSRSWIALNFENSNDEGGADRIDASTVEASDFTVEGHTVINAVVPSDKKVCEGDVVRSGPHTGIVSQAPDSSLSPAVTTAVTEDTYYLGTDEDESAKNITAFDADDKAGSDAVAPASDTETNDGDNTFVRGTAQVKTASKCDFEPRARIYLELADALASDAEPTVQLLGGVIKDIAGNNNVTQQTTALDNISPGISISITSSSGATSRAATDDDGSFTVRVTSDEDLGKFPRLFFATIKAGSIDDGVAKDLAIADVTGNDGVSLTEKDSNTWEKKVNADSGDIPGSGDRLVALLVTATDENGNPGNSAGWSGSKPALDADLDFKKLDAGGFLLEIDNRMEEAEIQVLPSINPGNVFDVTESTNPYIQIEFSEPDEYGIDTVGECRDSDENQVAADCAEKADIGDGDDERTDSHRGVEITKLELNGENQLDQDAFVDVNPYTYVLAVQGLEIGEHTIVYSAIDDVGNDVEDVEFKFEVQERQPYEVELQPGWNLISVPGDPFNPAVASVIGDLKADTVLGFQGGEWVTSVKNEDGRWQGTLTDIVGGYGYWVRTTVVETIETVIPPTLPTNNLPTVPIISGWNLVGVVDAAQRDPGDGVGEDADDYLTSLRDQWRVAYSFETRLNQWSKVLPGSDGASSMMLNGKGYWLWNSRPGTLVP